MAGFVPYKQPQAGGMDYGKLMQLLQMKQLMEAQGAQQPQTPSISGISDLLSSFGGGGAGGAAANSIMGSGGSTAAADVLSGTTMPSVGPTIANAQFLPTAPGASSLASVGVPAAVAVASVLGTRSGLNMLKGKQKNWKDASLVDNVGRGVLAAGTFGFSEVANKLFGGHKSTKDRQAGKWGDLYKQGKVSDYFVSSPVNQDQGVDDKKLASGKLGGKDVWATSAFFNKFSQPDKRWDVTGTEAQREQVANEILKNKLLDTKQGLTRFTDENAAQAIYDRVMGGKSSGILSDPNKQWTKLPGTIQAKGAAPFSPIDSSGINDFINQHGGSPVAYSAPRTDTPGFKNGKRINYGVRR